MTPQLAEGTSGAAAADVRGVEQDEIVHRADQLCRRAEPHTDSVPCAAHLHEAQRQLVGPAG